MIPNSRYFRLTAYLLAFLVFLNFGYAKKKEKDPIEALREKWSAFDFKFADDWQVEVSAFFILRSPEFMEEYFKILEEKQQITEEEITQQKTVLDEFLVVEVSMEALKKEDLAADLWKFELKDKQRNTYDPIKVESLPVAKGDEYIASFKSFQPVTVQKKEGGSTVESITPTFFVPEKGQNWVTTFILYFPKNNPETNTPIYTQNIKEWEIKANKKRVRLSGKWKIDKILKKK